MLSLKSGAPSLGEYMTTNEIYFKSELELLRNNREWIEDLQSELEDARKWMAENENYTLTRMDGHKVSLEELDNFLAYIKGWLTVIGGQ
jgi:hypothetical protein